MDIEGPEGQELFPRPDSAVFRDLRLRDEQRRLYEFLFERRDSPPTMLEIRDHMSTVHGQNHAQQDRRVRELRKWFHISTPRVNSKHVYVLGPMKPAKSEAEKAISGRVRAEVLSSKRCEQCGKTPVEDGVKLEVDHKIPQSWGGTNDIENLQPLCKECNHGKQAFYSSMSGYEDEIKKAASYLEPHKRIGELLKAFMHAGQEAPSEVIGVVASMHQYQEDWQKRLRELRSIGWDFTFRKQKEDGRVRTYYTLTKYAEWPEGNIKAAISRAEKHKKNAKKDQTS
ncbi:HNH endonuclease [Citricoccus muralis]|uniref:HNH endonuclease signature motif containing protein n=1 Tax=Citricoccus muralis TaxID=169134 RepID=A0ABY8H5E1_9MICC|nr:HNH endonuclease signature motif containing protein [Citricoccus muralis]WFP16354.1 HNH endonuclease signature motif containing protein [Citricoccus muralis]